MSQILQSQIIEQIEQLSDEQQQITLEFIRSLNFAEKKGVPGTDLLRFAGAISLDDLRAMEEAITTGCERVDANEW